MKHQLKARQYLRYSDDFVLVHEDSAQLLAWRERIREFLAERLRLSLTDPVAPPRLISNGGRTGADTTRGRAEGCQPPLVRPDYLLVRRRVVSRLKARLRDAEQKLVRARSGYTIFRHDPATLAGLRATWASYRAHLKMANSYRLWQRLVSRSGWMRHFFTLEEGLLVPRAAVPPTFVCLKARYRFFVNQRTEAILFFRVGRFYECYDEQAARMSRLLGLRLLARGGGFRFRCGVPLQLGPWCARALVAHGVPVALIRETDNRPWLGGMKPRELTVYWQPLPVEEVEMR